MHSWTQTVRTQSLAVWTSQPYQFVDELIAMETVLRLVNRHFLTLEDIEDTGMVYPFILAPAPRTAVSLSHKIGTR